jgi:hypothetical protein
MRMSTRKERDLLESSPRAANIFPTEEEGGKGMELTKAPLKVQFCATPNRIAKLTGKCRAIAQGLGSSPDQVMWDSVALGQVCPEYFRFPCHSFHRLLHTRRHPSSSEAGTTGQMVAKMPSGLSHPKLMLKRTVTSSSYECKEQFEWYSPSLSMFCGFRLLRCPSSFFIMQGMSLASSPTITNESVRLVSLLLGLILPPVLSSCIVPAETPSLSTLPAPRMRPGIANGTQFHESVTQGFSAGETQSSHFTVRCGRVINKVVYKMAAK